MKKIICGLVLIACFCFLCGCGADSDSQKAPIEKDSIEKVGDAASIVGYDGEAIDKGLREVNDLAKDREEAADEIFNE